MPYRIYTMETFLYLVLRMFRYSDFVEIMFTSSGIRGEVLLNLYAAAEVGPDSCEFPAISYLFVDNIRDLQRNVILS